MRVLVVYCHPNPTSFNAAVLDVVKRKLAAAGVETRIQDLYQDKFEPVLSQQGLADYHSIPLNREIVRHHVDNIEWCDSLIFVYPTWWYGLPAMLKGWLDRTLIPGSAFHLPMHGAKSIEPGLKQIKRIAVFTTCGATWLWTQLMGAPGKRTLLRGVRSICSPYTRSTFAAHYSMDSSTDASRAQHLAVVARKMDKFLASSRQQK